MNEYILKVTTDHGTHEAVYSAVDIDHAIAEALADHPEATEVTEA